MAAPLPSPLTLDLTLLRGFRYACRPDCGLCCYAEPRVEASERAQLLQIAPEADFRTTSGGSFLRARPDGGACQFLDRTRCRVWGSRPGPCREFPVSVHVGVHLQASLVLSCPGIDLGSLLLGSAWSQRNEPEGFEAEIASVQRRIGPVSGRQLEGARRRRARQRIALERTGQWVEEDEVRDLFRHGIPFANEEDFPVADPPSADEGAEYLPLFFDRRPGPIALAEGLGGWEFRELRPEGGLEPPVAVVAPPSRPPELDSGGRKMLEGYLRYFLERDALFGTVLAEIEPGSDGTVADLVGEELRAIAALVMSRAEVRRSAFRPADGPLGEREVVEGIRATDQELLDRPTLGDRL